MTREQVGDIFGGKSSGKSQNTTMNDLPHGAHFDFRDAGPTLSALLPILPALSPSALGSKSKSIVLFLINIGFAAGC